MSNVNEHYLETRVMSASPVELVRMLYGAATEAVREARRRLAAGEIMERSRRISSAVEVLFELHTALDPAKGGEVAARLAALYDYMERRLLEANQQQSDPPLAEVLNLLVTLAEGWNALPAEPAPAAQPAPPPPRPAPREEYGSGSGSGNYGRYGSYSGFAPAPALAGQSWSG